jgi:ATP-binding cassette subfamily F protein uup
VLEHYLDVFPGAVLTVSHDRYFLDRTAEKLLVFEGGGRIRRYEGSYSDYLEHMQAAEAEQTEAGQSAKPATRSNEAEPSAPGAGSTAANRPRKLSFKEQKEWESIESYIAELERKQADLRAQIESSGSDYMELQRLAAEEQDVSAQLDQAMTRWAELSELVEQIGRGK